MNRRPVLAALVLLACVLTAVGAGPPASAAGAEGGRVGVAAEPVRTAYRLDVVDHNVERRSGAIRAAFGQARASGARMIALQEVCWWQARDLALQHPTWTVSWRQEAEHPACREPGTDLLGASRRTGSGLVAMVTGPAAVSAPQLRHQVGEEYRGLACTHSTLRGTRVHLCSTHLANPGRTGNPRLLAAHLGQAREIRALTGRWAARGDLVVLAGDLNARPHSRPLSELYRVRGTGPFHEATACRRGVDVCRKAQAATYDGLTAKLDYVFVSANRMMPDRGHAVRVVRTSSDHHLLRAWAYVDLSARPSSSRSR